MRVTIRDMTSGRSIDFLAESWSDTITIYMRVMSGLMAVCLFTFGWGPLFKGDTVPYEQPVFAAVRRFASMHAWGIGFWIPAVLLSFAALSGRAVLYVAGSVLSALALGGWGYFVVSEWIHHNAVFTTGGLALYMLAVTFTVGLAFSPNQLAEEADVALQSDHRIIPLRPVDEDIASAG